MKVLKEGRTQTGWAHEFICTGDGNSHGGCGAQLLVEFADLFNTYSNHYDGSRDTHTTFRCPCGVLTDIVNYRGPRVTRDTSP